MKRNGRHRTTGRRVRPRPSRPDGFRPLSLIPPLPSDPEAGIGSDDPGTDGSPHPSDIVFDPPPHSDPSARSKAPGRPRPNGAAPEGNAPAGSNRHEHGQSEADGLDGDVPAGNDGQSEPDTVQAQAQAQARAQEIYDWMQEKKRRDPDTGPVRRLDGWKQSPPPPDRSRSDWSPPFPGGESNARFQASMRQITQAALDGLAERWGGVGALDDLDTEPLPDEAFDWSNVPVDLRPRVERVLAMVDDVCNFWFDLEHRTACRRLLARVAGEPWVIARRGKLETVAGAVVWTIASFNGTTRQRGRRGVVPASYIAAHLGLSSASAFSDRSIDIRIAAGIHSHRQGPEPVGEPTLIVSRRRRQAARTRDKLRRRLS